MGRNKIKRIAGQPIQGRSKYLNKDKQPPGTIRKHGDINIPTLELNIIEYSSDEFRSRKIHISDIANFKISREYNTWIHSPSSLNSAMLEEIGKRFKIHPLILENIQNIDHRPKLNDTENFNFIIQKGLNFRENSISKNHIGYLLFDKLVITFANGYPFSLIEERLKNKSGKIRTKGTDYLLFCFMDLLTDEYFELIDYLEQKTLKFEEELIKENYVINIDDFLKTKNHLDILKHFISPLTSIIEGLINSTTPPVSRDNIIYYKDLLNNTMQLNDLINRSVSNIDNILNLSINISGYKMNGIMKVLTIISTIFIPLTFIAGIYGMNFSNMPELGFRYGYPVVIAVMLTVAGIMIRFFRKKRWF